ncbi:MAG: glucosaminidase domain-containing protein [Bacilli bacterium]|nr:glucosaminidase domain-containing protein [Bacilli bacterium]
MRKSHIISVLLSICGTSMIVLALIIIGLTDKDSFISYSSSDQILTTSMKYLSSTTIQEVSMTSPPETTLSITEATQGDPITMMTIDEIAEKLNRYLGKDLLAGKGGLIASYCVSLQVDPFVATAIMLHETGCGGSKGCSKLTRTCYNVAGQKGRPNCMGAYKGYSSIDEGIRGAINNLHKNYYSMGYNTVERIGPKYAESNTWVSKINGYVYKLKS